MNKSAQLRQTERVEGSIADGRRLAGVKNGGNEGEAKCHMDV